MFDFSALVGQELTSVAFVQDHVVLHFDGPTVTFFAWPDVFREEGSYAYGEPEYRNVLCGILTEDVTAVSLEEGEAIEIEFESGIIIRLSLREEDLDVPVAGEFSTLGEVWEF